MSTRAMSLAGRLDVRGAGGALPTLARVDGWPINVANMQQAVFETVKRARAKAGFSVCPLNMDLLVKLRRDPQFRDAFGKSELVLADGAPVAYFAAKQDERVCRTPGADLIWPLVEAACAEGLPVYFFGSSSNVLFRVEQILRARLGPKLLLVGSNAPKQNFDPESADADAAIDRIVGSGARLCFLALGAPKQEVFAARAISKGAPLGFVCVGAGLDFVAGAQVRAPQEWQDRGYEWMWRLLNDPRRLTLRYVRCALLTLELAIGEAAGAVRRGSDE